MSRPEVHLEVMQQLDAWFGGATRVAVAFSGGVDSALVAFWARKVLGRDRCAAWTGDSPSLKRRDLAVARWFCSRHDIPLVLVNPGEIDDRNYASNPPDRCYHCKTSLYTSIAAGLSAMAGHWWICSGANLDDLGDYRPGLAAARHHSVRHPLLECGIGKSLVRELARANGLEVWDKPASPCLSSRIPYGESVTRGKLAQIEAAERWLLERGFAVCRVRHHGSLARVEVPQVRIHDLAKLWPDLCRAFLDFGFSEVEMDPEGLVSGKLNRAIGID
ncbi:ATP-dependent sacrificial sulfur transferase LarE [Thioalkalivibrio sp. XN279]|uniref:ATP-dependent sacrificial sulfur transferase LarE n=1 Tax=Thioalkalivibrio sp. XN279 TaxID=2714953 RepID=UPI00140C08FB|nr:ATP-dependent sacrificial sulfur transferase LarE [Thioalkalivibrio sp. XN279]NHA15359.1 ATP-dependent sacrificial sulfur transferase LarE [Thioalkalivibrio sp. XN279]